MTTPDQHIQAAADALRSGKRYLTDRPESMAVVAIQAWLYSVGMDAATLEFFAGHIPSGTVRFWADAVRVVESS